MGGPPEILVIHPNIFSSVLCIMQNFTLLQSSNFTHFSGVNGEGGDIGLFITLVPKFIITFSYSLAQ